MAKIFLLEDDPSLARAVIDWLLDKRHTVEGCATIDQARDILSVSKFDLWILDWHLPDGSGVELLENLRKRGERTPALVLTARSEIEDKEAGFSAGSDDYLTKPFNLRELNMRVMALLRRPPAFSGTVLSAGDLTLDSAGFVVRRGEQEIKLLPREFALLEFFLRHPDTVFSCEALLQRVWGSDAEVTPNTVETTIKRLRRKIDRTGERSSIRNIFKVGYKLVTDGQESGAVADADVEHAVDSSAALE